MTHAACLLTCSHSAHYFLPAESASSVANIFRSHHSSPSNRMMNLLQCEHRSLNLIWFSYSSGCWCMLLSQESSTLMNSQLTIQRRWLWQFRLHVLISRPVWSHIVYHRSSHGLWFDMVCCLNWNKGYEDHLLSGLILKSSSVLLFSCLYYLDCVQAVLHHHIFSVCYSAEQGISAISRYIPDTPWMYCCHIIMHCLLLIISVTWWHLKPPVKSVKSHSASLMKFSRVRLNMLFSLQVNLLLHIHKKAQSLSNNNFKTKMSLFHIQSITSSYFFSSCVINEVQPVLLHSLLNGWTGSRFSSAPAKVTKIFGKISPKRKWNLLLKERWTCGKINISSLQMPLSSV